ncbi:unnamed protein product [Periconia digitata]|uniref:Uncharacterized protein n=1 Tax=Periconia digitata TaxID=1303443 RepID=A0A9W4UGJ9_9PLEO|nr:unnamed protein product [Periconia digitata]
MKQMYVLCVVNPEEIRVQDRLNDSGNNGDGVVKARRLSEIPVEPIGDVQSTVRSESEKIVGGDRLCLPGSLEHEELGKNGN